MNLLLRLFLTFSSVSFFLVVYWVQSDIIFLKEYLGEYCWTIYIAYVLLPFALTAISLKLCSLLSTDSLNEIDSIETSNNDFLASYLAFFFVAISIGDSTTFIVVFGMTVLFTFFSRVSYFNPVFLVFGYNFYYVKTQKGVKLMLISKEKLKDPSNFSSMNVKRINDYTYIEE